jgi:hypothetical protein
MFMIVPWCCLTIEAAVSFENQKAGVEVGLDHPIPVFRGLFENVRRAWRPRRANAPLRPVTDVPPRSNRSAK